MGTACALVLSLYREATAATRLQWASLVAKGERLEETMRRWRRRDREEIAGLESRRAAWEELMNHQTAHITIHHHNSNNNNKDSSNNKDSRSSSSNNNINNNRTEAAADQ